MPTINPIYTAILDNQRVNKVPFREAWTNFAYALTDVAALRDHESRGQKLIFVGQNLFKYDAADTTTADDGVNCIHDSTGKRYKWLQFSGGLNAEAALDAHVAAVDPHTQYERKATTFKTVAALLANTSLVLGVNIFEGDVVGADGFRYEVAPASEANPSVTTDGGLKLYVLPQSGVVSLGAYRLSSIINAMPSLVDAASRGNVRGKAGSTYKFTSFAEILITKDITLDFTDCSLVFDGGHIAIKGEVVATGRLLTASVTQGTSVVQLNSVTGIEPGHLLYVSASDVPLVDWPDKKRDLVLVQSISGSDVTLAERLNFHYTLGEGGLTVEIYKPHKLTLIAPNMDCSTGSGHGGQAPFELYYLRGSVVESPKVLGPVGFDPVAQTVPRGVAIYQSWNTTIRNMDAERAGYPVLPGTGSRNIFVDGISGRDCRHLAVPASFCSGWKVENLRGSFCYQALDSHPSFDGTYLNCSIENDTEVSNVRTFGGNLRNVRLHSTATNAAGVTAQYGRLRVKSGYNYLKSRVFTINDFIVSNTGGRTNEMIGLYSHAEVQIDGLRCAEGALSFSGETQNDITRVIWGANNLVGNLPHPNIKISGNRKIRCKVDSRAPSVLDAYLDTGVYHIDLHKYMLPTRGRVITVDGQILSQQTINPTLVVPVRIHTSAWPDVEVYNRVVGKVFFTARERNNSGVQFSTLEKSWNFEHYITDTSSVNLPTTALSTIGPSASSTALTMTVGNITQAGNTELGVAGDTYVAFDLTLGGGLATSSISLDYRLELALMSPA